MEQQAEHNIRRKTKVLAYEEQRKLRPVPNHKYTGQ